jgi:hypothetical protein
MMTGVLILYAAVSFFEVRRLFKTGERKEAVIYLAIAGLAGLLVAYMMLFPGYVSFARLVLGALGIEG